MSRSSQLSPSHSSAYELVTPTESRISTDEYVFDTRNCVRASEPNVNTSTFTAVAPWYRGTSAARSLTNMRSSTPRRAPVNWIVATPFSTGVDAITNGASDVT